MSRLFALVLAALVVAIPIAAQAQAFDLVIEGGRVLDPESRLDAIRNIGIRDGKIVAVDPKLLQRKQRIDAKGLVVAPGFIDLSLPESLSERIR